MRTIAKYLLVVFMLINIFIVFSGKTWIYQGISITYLKGHTSSYINDFIHFPSNTIAIEKHQEWLVSKNYNKLELPEFITELNEELGTVAFIVIQNDSIQYEQYWNGYFWPASKITFCMLTKYYHQTNIL